MLQNSHSGQLADRLETLLGPRRARVVRRLGIRLLVARESISASVGWTIILQVFAIVALVVSRSILRTARAGQDGIPSTATSVALVATGGASAALIVAVLLAGTDLGIPLTLGPVAVVLGVIAISCAVADMQASRRSVPARL